VWKQFTQLSDHHNPLVFRVPVHIAVPREATICLRSEMRRVTDKSKYSRAVNSSKTETELYSAMMENTTLPPKFVPYHKYRKNKFDLHNPTRAQLDRRIAKQREFIARMTETRDRRLFREAYYNGPLITNMVKRHKSEHKELDKHANIQMARALVELSWRVAEDVGVHEYFDGHKQLFDQANKTLRNALVQDYTWYEVHSMVKKIRHHCVYADFEAKCVHLMGQPALELVAASFTRRAHSDVHESVKKILGIPTGKRHKETEVLKILQKEHRPIGIASLLDALYFLCQNARVAPIVAQIAPKCMHGFISGREGHDMILEVQALQELAEIKKEPLFIFTADVEKHFDMLPHEAIAYLDQMMEVPEPFFQRVASQIRSTINSIRIRDGKPGIAHQNSGGSQGCHLTPSLSALILAPLANALTQHAAASAITLQDNARERAQMFRKVINFADDWQMTTNDFQDGYGRFRLSEQICDVLKIKIKLVSISRNGWAILHHAPTRLIHNKGIYLWQKSARVLGACLHLQKNSECAQTKCGGKCNGYTTTKICQTCLDKMIINVGALPLPILDKVEIARKRILSVLEWATYTCTTQQEALLNAAKKIRHQLGGYGFGGYIEASILPAKLGGYGIEISQRHIAISTAATIERCLDRNGEAAELLIMTRRLHKSHTHEIKWHPALHKALQAGDDLQFDLHPQLLVLPDEYSSQKCPAQLHIYNMNHTKDTASLIVIVRAIHGRVGAHHLIENRPKHEKAWIETPTEAHIRMLARIIENECELSKYVTLAEKLPQQMHIAIEKFRNTPKKYGIKGRVFLSVVARTPVQLLTNDTSMPVIPAIPSEDKSIPQAYPIAVTDKGKTFVKTSLRSETTEKLNTALIQEYTKVRQIAELVGTQNLDHEAGAVCAGTLRGVHYDGPLKTDEANMLLQLRTGALIKTGKMLCTCGEPLSLKHVAERHVPVDELEGVIQTSMREAQFGPITVGFTTPKFLAFGFIPADMFPRNVPPEKHKAFKKWKLKVAAALARVGLRAMSQHGPMLPFCSTPQFIVPTGADTAAKTKYLALADAALDTKQQEGMCIYGLGGYVQDRNGTIIKQFMVRRRLPREDSCLGEHCASLVLTAMVRSLELNDVCFGADNTAVPNQNEGLWATNSELSLKVRERTLHVRAEIEGNIDVWFPREENTLADRLSKQALRRTVCDPEWVRELDKVLEEMFPMFAFKEGLW